MKKLLFFTVLSFTITLGFGQSIKKANNYLEKGDYAKAKSEIDAFLQKKPEDAEANYIKSKIYSKIADSTELQSLVTGDARLEALEAFQKAAADTNDNKMKLQFMQDNYGPIFSVYAGYYADAAAHFNQGAQTQNKEEFAKAMELFQKANEVGQYIGTRGWANIAEVDTILVLNIGKAALNAGNEKVAEQEFLKLADAGINGMANSEDNESFLVPYQWLTMHYKKAGDVEKMLKYAQLGKTAFPTNDYFDLVLMDYYRENDQQDKIFEQYEQLLSRNPDSLNYRFNYANELFGYIYNVDEGDSVANKEQFLEKLREQLDKAYATDANDVNTNWLYAQYYYNQGIETRDEAMKTKDAAQKKELNEKAKESWNKAIPYAEKALSELMATKKQSDKSRYKSIVNLMQNIYQSLNDEANLKKYQDLYDKADDTFNG